VGNEILIYIAVVNIRCFVMTTPCLDYLGLSFSGVVCQWVVPILRCCFLLGKVGFVGWSVEKIGYLVLFLRSATLWEFSFGVRVR
jgi:hypothetical protein